MKFPVAILLFFVISFLSLIFPLKLAMADNSEKTALILHGWPQPVEVGSINYPYLQYFQSKGYKVYAPKLFTKDFALKEPNAKNYIESLLDSRKPDVIVGISVIRWRS